MSVFTLKDQIWCEEDGMRLEIETMPGGYARMAVVSMLDGSRGGYTTLAPYRARRLADLLLGIEKRPVIVCLCGSTRFIEAFNAARKAETLAGKIVLSIEIVTTQSREEDPQHVDPNVKARLDELHLRKIDLADEVLILNVGGYIGESTSKELQYALARHKPVRFLEPRIPKLEEFK